MQPAISPPDLRTMVLWEVGDRALAVSCLSIEEVAALAQTDTRTRPPRLRPSGSPREESRL